MWLRIATCKGYVYKLGPLFRCATENIHMPGIKHINLSHSSEVCYKFPHARVFKLFPLLRPAAKNCQMQEIKYLNHPTVQKCG